MTLETEEQRELHMMEVAWFEKKFNQTAGNSILPVFYNLDIDQSLSMIPLLIDYQIVPQNETLKQDNGAVFFQVPLLKKVISPQTKGIELCNRQLGLHRSGHCTRFAKLTHVCLKVK